jgi:Flp pilus assembly protein TadG
MLLAVLVGIFQFGIVFKNWLTVTQAARDGARAAAVGRISGDCATRGAAAARTTAGSGTLTLSSVTTVTSPASGCPAQGANVSVTVRYPYSISILGAVTVLNGQLQATSTMRTE